MYKTIFTTLLALLLLTVSNICTVALAHVVSDTSMSDQHMTHSKIPNCEQEKNCDDIKSCCLSNSTRQPQIAQLTFENDITSFPNYHHFSFYIPPPQDPPASIVNYTPQLIRIGIMVKRE